MTKRRHKHKSQTRGEVKLFDFPLAVARAQGYIIWALRCVWAFSSVG